MKTLAQLCAEFGIHAEPADDCGNVRLFVHGNADAHRAAFDLADFTVSAVCGPWLALADKTKRGAHCGLCSRRASDGVAIDAQGYALTRYGPIPAPVQGEFQHNYGYARPLAVHGFSWSSTFGRWSALVTFADGWRGYTYPRVSYAVTQTAEGKK